MMNIQQIAYDYVQACKLQEARESALHDAFVQLNPENQVFGTADAFKEVYFLKHDWCFLVVYKRIN